MHFDFIFLFVSFSRSKSKTMSELIEKLLISFNNYFLRTDLPCLSYLYRFVLS